MGQKSKKCPFYLKISLHGILRMPIFIPTLVFWIFNPKSIFRQTWFEKIKVAQKFAHSISRLILIPTLIFYISNPSSIFGLIWAEKFRVVCFAWKLAHGISRMLILIPRLVSEIPTETHFLGNFKSKKLNCLLCLEVDIQSISRIWLQGYRGRFGSKDKNESLY